METSQLAAAAIDRYYAAQRCHPEQYFNGFNVLILLDVLKHLATVTKLPSASTEPINEEELKAAVGFVRRCAHENAVRSHDHPEQFWTLTTAAGLEMLAGNSDAARQNFRDACNLPDATIFEFQTITSRLEVLQGLGYSGNGVVEDGIRIVQEALSTKTRIHGACNGVYVFAGCTLDSCIPTVEHVGSEVLQAVNQRISEKVGALGVSSGDLAIVGLCHLSDVMFAEACRERKARVRLLIPRKEQLPLLPCKGFGMFPEWQDKAYKLVRECESWYQDEHLGEPPEGVQGTERNGRWIANTATMEVNTSRMQEGKGLHALLLGAATRCSDPSFMEKEIRRSAGEVHWIELESLAAASGPS